MLDRYIKSSLFIILLFIPCIVSAFSISEIAIDSKLNEKLNGEIAFHLSPTEKPSNINVKIISPAFYKQNNLVRQKVLNSVSFKRIGTTIAFTSKTIITQPVLDLLVEINSGNAQKMRHYKIVFGQQVSKNKISTYAIKQLKSKTYTDNPRKTAVNVMSMLESLNARLISDRKFGPIQKDDDILTISKYLGKHFGVSSKTMQLGLLSKNIHAFSDNKRSILIEGMYLKIPESYTLNNTNSVDQEKQPSHDKTLTSNTRALADDLNTRPLLKKGTTTRSPLVEKDSAVLLRHEARIQLLENSIIELKVQYNTLQNEQNKQLNFSNDDIKLGENKSIKEKKSSLPNKQNYNYVILISIFAFIFFVILSRWILMKKTRTQNKPTFRNSYTGVFDEIFLPRKNHINPTYDYDLAINDLGSESYVAPKI